MKLISFLSFALSLLIFSSCVTKAEFIPIHKIVAEPKLVDSVELLVLKPRRAAICVGLISTDGNSLASHDDGVKEARKKAACLGADFIMLEKSGTETATYFHPSHFTYQSNSSAYINGNSNSFQGYASQNTTADCVGPSTTTYYFPWAIFSAWIFRPSTPGIELDENNIVIGFYLQSNAEEAGMMIGDKILGIDGMDINDDKMSQHLMGVFPSNTMIYSVLRDGKRMEITFRALPN